jgi:nucleoside-diphosphate-sugar epimerase
LLAQRFRVICVDNLETASLENIEHVRDEAFVNHDVIEHIEVDEPLDFVFPLASPASPIDYPRLAESGEHVPVNLGRPREFTILELAETVLRLSGSQSEIVFEPLPVDDPQIRQPDITRGETAAGWEREIELEAGLRRHLPTLEKEPVRA